MTYTPELLENIKKKFLTPKNKINQYIFKEDYRISKNLTKLYADCMSAVEWAQTITESIYCIMNSVYSCPKCSECDNRVYFDRYGIGYRKYCSIKCRGKSSSSKISRRNTNLTKYGVEFIAQLPGERIKRAESFRIIAKQPRDRSKQVLKTKATILSRYGNINAGWLSNGKLTRVENGWCADGKEAYKQYRKDVDWFSKQNDLTSLENYELRDNHCRNENAYHLDHIVSVLDCYRFNIPPQIAGNIVNLRFIHWKENLSKFSKSDMTVQLLLEKYNALR